MFTFYWLYQKDDSWLAVFKTGNNIQQATDKESLEKALSSVHYLVSYGNYQESDKFLANILSDGKNSFLQKYLSIDLRQELRNLPIEEIGYYLRMDIYAKTIEEYCLKRIAICEKIFEEREEYLETKFEIVKEFKLPARSVMKTRANLASEILEAKKIPKRPNVLIFDFDKNVPLNELPEKLVSFYKNIKKEYMNSLEENLKAEKFRMTLAGLTHVYGVGGLHAAKERYKGSGTYLLIDVKQFFPSIILNNNFLTKAVKQPQKFVRMYQKKVETEKLTYKTLINAVNGSMNNPYSSMYDPSRYYSVTISGQLIITHLILLLETFYEELIQTNTDGILIKINPILENDIREIVDMWCEKLRLTVSITKITNVWQKDVNNYLLKKDDGTVTSKGIFAKSTYLSNNIPVVKKGVQEFILNGTKPQDFVVQQYKNGPIEDFYYVGKLQTGFEKVEQKIGTRYVKKNNTVCGIATINHKFGGLFQVKDDLHSKLPGSPDNFMSIKQAQKKEINAEWYIDQIEKNIF